MTLTLQIAMKCEFEVRIVLINFSADFHGVDRQGILIKVCTLGIGGSVLSVLTQFYLIGHSKLLIIIIIWSMVGCWGYMVNVVSGELKGSVLGSLLFHLRTSEFFSTLSEQQCVWFKLMTSL